MPVGFRGAPVRTGGLIGRAGGAGSIRSSVRVYGVPQAIAKMKGVDGAIRLDLGQLMVAAAKFIEKRAKEYVPKLTGNLESGIKLQKIASYSYNVTASSRDGDNPDKNSYEYAPFVEKGTSHMAGRFFMQRAFEDVKPLVAVEMKVLKARIERAIG